MHEILIIGVPALLIGFVLGLCVELWATKAMHRKFGVDCPICKKP